MFGSKLKTWMENHIGRPKRKTQLEKEKPLSGVVAVSGRGLILESSESLAHSDTGISSGSQQVLSSSATDNRESYCTTTMESERSSGMSHCPTAVSLPSPESAYSTGYSTDGASPGGTGPPEYYINIRTGKHYFPSPAPTPTSPHPNIAFSQLNPLSKTLPEHVPPPPDQPGGVRLSTFVPDPPAKSPPCPNPSTHFEIFNFSKSPCKKSPPKSQLSSFKLFLKSPKQDKGKSKPEVNKTPVFENKKKILSPGKNVKWYKQPFQKFGQRRVDDESSLKNEMKKDAYLDRNLGYLLIKDNAASPRQRNRIKTNPWLPTEPMSSQNFHSLNFSPSLARNRSCTNTPLQNRKEVDAIQQRLKQMSVKYEESKEYLNGLEKVVGRHVGQKLYLELSDHSEEDLTLNEMMGTYNESYVYEKETDILSDSDPTDCEDYVSDSEADNGGDEQDSHDDELDFIDNGSISESEENFLRNTGKCTYHDVYVKKNSFLYKSDRHHSRKGSDSRKSFRRDLDSKTRRSNEEKKRKLTRKPLKEEEGGKRKGEGKLQKAELNENVGGLNLSRVLLQRMMEKNVSKSAEGTPVSIRRQKLMKELRETHIGSEKRETKANSLLLADAEADRKYKQLIEEAQNIFESMQNSPVIHNRKKILEKKPNSADVWKKSEVTSRAQSESSAKKSPKNLGLKLQETPKKLKTFSFSEKSSFKAHSPLDPLGPTFRNFTVFKPVNSDSGKVSSSSSEDSEPSKAFKPWEEDGAPGSPIVPIAFQSVDLGKPLTSYCPQSEPVKRKIYSCSKTYDKLVKQFETKPTIFEEKVGRARHWSLMSKRRSEMPRRGNQGLSKAQRRDQGDGAERYLCADLGYSPRVSPRRSSMPGGVASPGLSQRPSYDLEFYR